MQLMRLRQFIYWMGGLKTNTVNTKRNVEEIYHWDFFVIILPCE